MTSDSIVLEPVQPDPDGEPSSQSGKRPESHLETSPMPHSSKGKAPIVEISAAFELHCDEGDGGCSEPQQCGICLSEEGQAVRGRIDSCDHYFCFICIVEWSKIESRCPLCKRRFSSIRRVRKDGSFIGDRAVVVPVRDQIYDPNGNTTSGPLDLYANTKCNVCANSTDENLLLLCDLCDTAVHTYCAGLGATVPEGDWFCQECALMKAEEFNTEPEAELGASHASDQCNTGVPSVEAPISVYDIVREPKDCKEADPEVNRLFKLFSPRQKQSMSSTNALLCVSHQNAQGAHRGSGSSKRSEVEVRECSARTLPRCRDVQKRIHALRENWNALRSGSLTFPSGRFDDARNNSRANDKTCGYRSNGSQSSENSVQAARQNGSLGGDATNEYDVDRAWKMFDVAKSITPQKLCGSSSFSSKNISLQISASKGSKTLFSSSSSKSVLSRPKSKILTGSKVHCSFSKSDICVVSKRSEQHNNGIRLERGKSSVNHGGLAAASCVTSIVSPNHNTQKLTQTDVFCRQAVMLPHKKPGKDLPYLYHQKDFSTRQTSSAESPAGTSGALCSKSRIKPVNLSGEECCGRNVDTKVPGESEDNGHSLKYAQKRASTKEFSSGSKRLKINDAKSEVQALVKLNLKLLTGKKKLEVDKFKDIARCSTHEILAACGFEPHRHNKLPIPKLICSHRDKLQDRHKSLMPGSCSECFYVFVKDVVCSSMSQKTTH